MNVLINDEEFQFSGNNLIDLLDEYNTRDSAGIAIAVNETVISKNNWQSCMLKEGDSILIITPVQGG